MPNGSERPLLGICLAVMAMIVFCIGDALAKILTQSLPIIEIAWIRYVSLFLILAPVLLKVGIRSLRSRRPKVQIVRGLGVTGSNVLINLSVRYLPLSDTTALGFVAPLFTTALAVPLLREKVGMKRWSAVIIGLFGILVVATPTTSSIAPAAIFPLLSALCWSIAMIYTRKASLADGAITTLAFTAISGVSVLSVFVPFVWITPNSIQLELGMFMGVTTAVAHGLLVPAYRHAEASLLAPFSYTQIIWASILGMTIFGDVPSTQVILGAAVIAGAGIYVTHREQVHARRTDPSRVAGVE